MSRRNWTKEVNIFTTQEDIELTKIVEEVGENDWPGVAKALQHNSELAMLAKRTGKQCRERWYNQLNPTINKN